MTHYWELNNSNFQPIKAYRKIDWSGGGGGGGCSLKRCSFSLLLKAVGVSAVLTSAGRSFHLRGARTDSTSEENRNVEACQSKHCFCGEMSRHAKGIWVTANTLTILTSHYLNQSNITFHVINVYELLPCNIVSFSSFEWINELPIIR